MKHPVRPLEQGEEGGALHYEHPQSIVETSKVGARSKFWAFSHVLPGAVIGADANICDHVFLENDVIVGDRVTVKCGVQLWDGLRLEDDVFIGPNVTFTNDPFPRSKVRPEVFPQTRVCRGASIGANATILPGLTIGSNSMVGAGSVVTRNVPANAIVIGNPARITGYTDADKPVRSPNTAIRPAEKARPVELRTTGPALVVVPRITDLRGALSYGEVGAQLPFVPNRFFVVYDVPSFEVRGEHAHKQLQEFLVCVKGSCNVMVDDGSVREEITLDTPNLGLYIPPRVWRVHYKYSADSVLLVLASDLYDADDYIRNYGDFLAYVGKA